MLLPRGDDSAGAWIKVYLELFDSGWRRGMEEREGGRGGRNEESKDKLRIWRKRRKK